MKKNNEETKVETVEVETVEEVKEEVVEETAQASLKDKVFGVLRKAADVTVKAVGVITIVGAAVLGGAALIGGKDEEDEEVKTIDLGPESYTTTDDKVEETSDR